MSATSQSEHESFWTKDKEMADQTRAYEQRAIKGIKSMMTLPSDSNWDKLFEKYLWLNEGRQGSRRSQVFDLDCQADYHNPLESTKMLMLATEEPNSDQQSRRIIIMEDIDRRHAELLGVRLNIPPEFFLAHCSRVADLSVVDQCSAVQYGRYWRAQIPQVRRILPISKEECGSWHIETGSFRHETNFVQTHGADMDLSFMSHVSLWITHYDPNSWTVVLLVEPQTVSLRSPREPQVSKMTFPVNYSFRYRTEVLPSATEGPLVQAEHRSMFDSLVTAYSTTKVPQRSTPFTATAPVRNLIRAAWEEYTLREERRVHKVLLKDMSDHDYYSGLRPMEVVVKKEDERAKHYQATIISRQWSKIRQRELNDIIQAFAFDDVRLYVGQKNEETEKLALEREQRLWQRLFDKMKDMDVTLSHHLDEYAQRAAMEERFETSRQAHVVERQARSAGQLTKIATIIVPCMFVAAIFSMGGSFAAGEELFYVYWAISVPATVALLAWVLQKEICQFWQDLRSKHWRKSQRARLRLGSRMADPEKGSKNL